VSAPLAERFRAAYDWIDSAGEWDEALADPDTYAAAAACNAEQHDVTDVTEAALVGAIEWYREHRAQS